MTGATRRARLVALDPYDCPEDCPNCRDGSAVRLKDATPRQVADLVLGKVVNDSGVEIALTVTNVVPAGALGLRLNETRIRAEAEINPDGFTKEWDLDRYLMATSLGITPITVCANCETPALPGSAYCSWTCKNEDDRHDDRPALHGH